MVAHSAEYGKWLESLGGFVKTAKEGKSRHFLLHECLNEKNGCRGCEFDTFCDSCKVRLCYYLAKRVNGDLLCPECWEGFGVPVDDRMLDDETSIEVADQAA